MGNPAHLLTTIGERRHRGGATGAAGAAGSLGSAVRHGVQEAVGSLRTLVTGMTS
ncbi:hypothetical protein N4G70_12495 [Streptomyces sp. ASQP_92]|uniref:hypothetical protein n=1 Tax=Streptomyces sp. ASQP_92 TaxID=2979116 RepID=UPI0021C16EE0|nr:hypothetical protein [Streptomyces sp. ASQP_92]MCT9089687.1 hypothetical protein [Streptomyces sp. ASQP_92]